MPIGRGTPQAPQSQMTLVDQLILDRRIKSIGPEIVGKLNRTDVDKFFTACLADAQDSTIYVGDVATKLHANMTTAQAVARQMDATQAGM